MPDVFAGPHRLVCCSLDLVSEVIVSVVMEYMTMVDCHHGSFSCPREVGTGQNLFAREDIININTTSRPFGRSNWQGVFYVIVLLWCGVRARFDVFRFILSCPRPLSRARRKTFGKAFTLLSRLARRT